MRLLLCKKYWLRAATSHAPWHEHARHTGLPHFCYYLATGILCRCMQAVASAEIKHLHQGRSICAIRSV